MLNRKTQTRTKSLSPFSVTIGEIASIASPQEIQKYREEHNIHGESLSEIGNHFALRDDAKKVVLAKLLGVKPYPGMSIAEAVNDLVETRITLWELEGHEVDLPHVSKGLSTNQMRNLYLDSLRQALKLALRDMVDEAAYMVENYIRNRVAPSGGSTPEDDLERLELAKHQLDKYGLGNLSILDFDRENNEKLILMKRKQTSSRLDMIADKDAYYIPVDEYIEDIEELQKSADFLLEEASSEKGGSFTYKKLLQSGVNDLNRAITICDLAIAYYADLRKINTDGNFVEYVSELIDKKSELKKERETLFDFITLYDEEKIATRKFNWYRYAKNF